MLRTLLSRLWSKVQPTPEVAPEAAAAPPVVDNRTAFDRAVQRNPQLVPKGMTVAEFGVWCEEIGEKYEDALEFYSEVLVLKDPAEAKKIAAAHPDPGPDPVPVPHDPGPGPSPTDPGPDPGSRNVVPIPSRSQSRSRPGPDPGPTERDVVLDFVAWARRRVHPSRGSSPTSPTTSQASRASGSGSARGRRTTANAAGTCLRTCGPSGKSPDPRRKGTPSGVRVCVA
jgi:hypothetical protein